MLYRYKVKKIKAVLRRKVRQFTFDLGTAVLMVFIERINRKSEQEKKYRKEIIHHWWGGTTEKFIEREEPLK